MGVNDARNQRIYDLARVGVTYKRIAEKYGLSVASVGNIVAKFRPKRNWWEPKWDAGRKKS